jgi:hypothetical protein
MWYKFKKLFAKVYRYRIILKNGQSIYVTARDLNLGYNTSSGEVTKWEVTGIRGKNYPVYIVPSDIVAVVRS